MRARIAFLAVALGAMAFVLVLADGIWPGI
jgi:hypothetical protein